MTTATVGALAGTVAPCGIAMSAILRASKRAYASGESGFSADVRLLRRRRRTYDGTDIPVLLSPTRLT